ncbi:MoaD/ThiS family protein [uncultured Mucilaginibacter sp.]|uniref:MoaD/ThiS family protein n=1 Tax=uncultured Mucilaginibacter sp. TaxID=797541 RepID=UPI00261167E6|nr:MoaD/ThiS family protein [uncultured Mucilaginibacter sp.]
MTIEVFAVLKDYFDKEFQLQSSAKNIAELKQQLTAQNPEAANVLELCRFAVRDEFVDQNYPITTHDTISIIPPSSGG